MERYRPRIVDKILKNRLEYIGAIFVEGMKWCGKTTSCRQMAESTLFMNDPDVIEQNVSMADMKPSILLKGKVPRLIDEWQIAPKLWDAVRFEVDMRGEPGQFMLTGSLVPGDRSKIFHTGIGRFSWVRMRPMSLFESGESSGEVGLKELFDGKEPYGTSKIDINGLATAICRGGWPASIFVPTDVSLRYAFDYVDAVVESDIRRVDGIKRNPAKARKFMKSYARLQGTQSPNTTIAEDMRLNESDGMDQVTVSSYITALKSIFVIEDMPAWNPNLRSKTAIRGSDTRYFSDPSIATASLGFGPEDLMNDLNTFGFVFEALCIRDLRTYAEAIDGEVFHYKDKDGLECDAVVHLRNGKYGLLEIKLGGDKAIDNAASNLLKLEAKLDLEKMGKPSFKAVIVGVGDEAYVRKDGVFVIPIGCMKD